MPIFTTRKNRVPAERVIRKGRSNPSPTSCLPKYPVPPTNTQYHPLGSGLGKPLGKEPLRMHQKKLTFQLPDAGLEAMWRNAISEADYWKIADCWKINGADDHSTSESVAEDACSVGSLESRSCTSSPLSLAGGSTGFCA